MNMITKLVADLCTRIFWFEFNMSGMGQFICKRLYIIYIYNKTVYQRKRKEDMKLNSYLLRPVKKCIVLSMALGQAFFGVDQNTTLFFLDNTKQSVFLPVLIFKIFILNYCYSLSYFRFIQQKSYSKVNSICFLTFPYLFLPNVGQPGSDLHNI